MTKRKLTKHEDDVRRGLRTAQYNGIIDTQLKAIDELKAEVERLTSDLQMEKENKDRLVREWQKANNEVYGLQTQVAALIDDHTRLKAEVERLRKAGDNLERVLTSRSGSYEAGNASHEWQSAKNYKPSV